MKNKRHFKRNLLIGMAGVALVAAIVYDKMNKDKINTNLEEEETSYNEETAKEE